MTLQEEFGGIDIYLFDQLQRRRIAPGDRILDVGCGFGRNLVYLLRAGYHVAAVDGDADAIQEVRGLAARLAPSLPPGNFRQERVEQSTFPPASFTVVIASAVLHFARDGAAFDAMIRSAWRLLAPGGMLFCRLASTIGMESRVRPIGDDPRRYRLPDGTDRYLVDEATLVTYTADLGGQLLDPIKTTVVQDQRAMTTWVVRKTSA